ncbi:MAG: hypothetical protein QM504_13455 [Pseudomonadota bacterium]
MTKGVLSNQVECESIFQQKKDSGLNIISFCQLQDLCCIIFYKNRRDAQVGKNTNLSSKGVIKIKKPSSSRTTNPTASVCILYYQKCKLEILLLNSRIKKLIRSNILAESPTKMTHSSACVMGNESKE